jgi:hypothetical protein
VEADLSAQPIIVIPAKAGTQLTSNLIDAGSPDWRDLAEEFGFAPLS